MPALDTACLQASRSSATAQHNKTINPPTATTNTHVHTRDVHMHAHAHNIPPPTHTYKERHAQLWVIIDMIFNTVIKGQVKTEIN